VLAHNRRELRVRAWTNENGSDDEAHILARASVVPGSGVTDEPTRLQCEDGEQLLLAGNLTIIDGTTGFADMELAGLFLLEEGATLDLHNVILRGTIITRSGLCSSNPKLAGGSRPRVNISGGLRLLAGTELPDVAMCAPDLRFTADAGSSIEIRGFAVADEIEVSGRGCVRGMVVSGESESIDEEVSRPGHGREPQAFPSCVDLGGERVTRISFPIDPVPEAVLDCMLATDIE
jgi:hypothetical protein